MKNTNKHTIWTNRLDLEEYRNSMPPEEIAGLTDEELTSRMCEENELWLSDEKENLSKIQYNEPLLIISDLGLWRGRFPGYKDVDSGKLTDCFSCTCGEFVEWYVDMYGNLRCDDTFVGDEGWHRAAERYENFLRTRDGQKVLFLELGVGYNTPVIIKYPFWQMTAKNPNAIYACINQGQAVCPQEIKKQSICMDADIGAELPTDKLPDFGWYRRRMRLDF